MTYNLTLINSTGLVTLNQTVNYTLMFGWYGTLIAMTIWAIIFFSINHNDPDSPKKNLAMSTFMAFILCLPLRALSLIPQRVVLLFFIASAVLTFWYFISES